MKERRGAGSIWHGKPARALVASLIVCTPLWAADTALENEKLTLLIRQLDMLERVAQQSAALTGAESNVRYHFDYARLHADIARIRAGVEDYLTPRRAQPRDPDSLNGLYQREAEITP